MTDLIKLVEINDSTADELNFRCLQMNLSY